MHCNFSRRLRLRALLTVVCHQGCDRIPELLLCLCRHCLGWLPRSPSTIHIISPGSAKCSQVRKILICRSLEIFWGPHSFDFEHKYGLLKKQTRHITKSYYLLFYLTTISSAISRFSINHKTLFILQFSTLFIKTSLLPIRHMHSYCNF